MQIFDKKFTQNKARYFVQCILATISVLLVLMALDSVSNTAITASLGASCFIAFTMPHIQASKPRFLIGRKPSEVLLREVMSAPVKFCNLGDDVQKCADIFRILHVRHLAVVGEGVLIGLISMRDILVAEMRGQRERLKVFQEAK